MNKIFAGIAVVIFTLLFGLTIPYVFRSLSLGNILIPLVLLIIDIFLIRELIKKQEVRS